MPSADLGSKSHPDDDGDPTEQHPGVSPLHHQPGLPFAILGARPPTDLPCHSPDPGDQPLASDTTGGHTLLLEVKASTSLNISETLLRLLRPVASYCTRLALKDLLLAPVDWRCRTSSWPQADHDALCELQHLLAQAEHYARADPDRPGHDVRPPPLPGALPRPPPHPGEGEGLLLFLLECSRPQPETRDCPLDGSALWRRHFLQLVAPCQPLSAAIGQYTQT